MSFRIDEELPHEREIARITHKCSRNYCCRSQPGTALCPDAPMKCNRVACASGRSSSVRISNLRNSWASSAVNAWKGAGWRSTQNLRWSGAVQKGGKRRAIRQKCSHTRWEKRWPGETTGGRRTGPAVSDRHPVVLDYHSSNLGLKSSCPEIPRLP